MTFIPYQISSHTDITVKKYFRQYINYLFGYNVLKHNYSVIKIISTKQNKCSTWHLYAFPTFIKATVSING